MADHIDAFIDRVWAVEARDVVRVVVDILCGVEFEDVLRQGGVVPAVCVCRHQARRHVRYVRAVLSVYGALEYAVGGDAVDQEGGHNRRSVDMFVSWPLAWWARCAPRENLLDKGRLDG